MMRIPVANLSPILESTRPDWQARLAGLFTRMQFILGDEVAAFEKEFAAITGAQFAVGVGNGTDAIELCLRDAGLANSGKVVLTSALTAPFTAVAIRAAGCQPRFADVNPETLQIDPDDAADRIRRDTAALIPVHLYGQPCEIDRLAKLARQAGKILIQDACQAHGAQYRGRPLTDFSRHVAYSFYPTKNLGCLGDGGGITTSNSAVNRRLRSARDGGRRGGQVAYTAGINSRLDEMQACYLRAFLPQLSEWNRQRTAAAAFYDQALGDCPGVQLVHRTEDSVCHLYVIRTKKRDQLRAHLAKHGIGSGIHYPVPLHLHPAFRDCGQKRGELPHAERACREIVSLPLWPGITPAALDEVATRMRDFFGQ